MRGATNRTKDGLYCVFLEYDNILLGYVEDELKRLQDQFGLSDFIILESSKDSYHCYCFDKVSYVLYRQIQDNATIDKKWVTFPIQHGTHNWVLRYTAKKKEKPQFISHMLSPYNRYQKSLPHIRLVEKIINRPIENRIACDTESELYIGGYYV